MEGGKRGKGWTGLTAKEPEIDEGNTTQLQDRSFDSEPLSPRIRETEETHNTISVLKEGPDNITTESIDD